MSPARAGGALDHRIGPRGRLTIRQAAGTIALRGVEGDTVRVTADDAGALREHFSVEAREGSLELRQATRLGFGLFSRAESLDLRVDVPHGASLSIEGQSVDIDASDLSGDKSFRTASGELTLHRLAGPVDLETVSGDVRLEGRAPVDLRAKSVSGDVEIRVPLLRRLDLGTTSGDAVVDCELKGAGPFAIRTISGDVSIVGRGGFRVEAETITGDLSSELPAKRESLPGRKVITIGRPGPTLSFRSVSGDFHVAAPRAAAPSLEEDAMADDATPTGPGGAAAGQTDAPTADARRLEILRQLERGEISVAEAGERIGELDEVRT